METKTAHLITGTRADVVEALTRMIMEKNPDAGEITFLELPERAGFRALVEEPVSQEAAPKPSEYETLKEVAVAAMDEIGRAEVLRILGLFRLLTVAAAEGKPCLIRAVTATLQIVRFASKEHTELKDEATKAATQIYRAFDDAEGF